MGKRRRRPWLARAIIKALISVIPPAIGLVASRNWAFLEPYRNWVWAAFVVLPIAAMLYEFISAREPSEHEPEPKPLRPPPTGDRSISIGGSADGSVLNTGDGGIIVHDVGGDVVHGDKISIPVQPSVTSLHQLPPPPGDFTGREAELDDLLDKVKEGGIAISGLHGAGGIGKTALALKLAEQLTPDYPDAQIYLDLRGVDPQHQQPVTPADAMAHVIRAWHPTANLPENEADLSAVYMSALHGKQALLLLDNAADAEQVTPLLPPKGCLALVTSRQHFDLPRCYTRSLDMLTPEDAGKLVQEIAKRVTKQEADDLAKLCGRLPFALEKAARTLKIREDLSVAKYMEQLRNAKGKLGLIDASLTLSYDLLTAEQQAQWRMLGVFPGSFDAPAAAAVWDVERRRAEDELGELYLRSMVECETEGRYRLHDLSRVYADSKLSETGRAVAQRRHAEHYVRVARAADDLYEKGGESVLAGLGLFDLERGNIEAGQRWASQHEREDDRAAELCVGYALGCPHVLDLRLHPREQIEWLSSALQSARRLKKRDYEASALGNLGIAYKNLGEYRRAIELQEQSLAIQREMGDRRGEAAALGNLGNAYHWLGEYRRAIEFHEQGLAIERETGDRRGEANSLGNLGLAYDSLGEYRRAIEFHEQSLAIEREIGNRLGEAISLWNISLTLDELGERAQAIANARAALDIYERIEAPDAAKVHRRLAEWQAEE